MELLCNIRHSYLKCDLFGLGSMIGGFAQGALNYTSQQKTNQYNYKIAQETNATNRAIARENNEFNERMWNKENEYNTPAAQRERLAAAGLNPNLMLNGSDTGNASSAPTADTSGTAQMPAQMIAPQVTGVAEGVAALDNMLFQKSMQKANTDNLNADTVTKQIENRYRAAKLMAEIRKLYSDGKISDEQVKALGLQNEITRDTKDWQKEHIKVNLENDIKRFDNLSAEEKQAYAQTAYIETMTALNKVHVQWLPSQLKADLSLKIAQASLAYAGAELSLKEAKKVVADTLKSYAETKGIKVKNGILEDTASGIVEELNSRNAVETHRNEIRKQHYEENPIADGFLGVGTMLDDFNPFKFKFGH